MQSTENKSKRSRNSAKEANTTPSQSPVAAAEENTTARRKASGQKANPDTTPAAKQHRGAAKKSAVRGPAPLNHADAVDAKPALAAPAEISHANIASLAYSYWAERGHQGGSAEEDWFRAESQLTSRQ